MQHTGIHLLRYCLFSMLLVFAAVGSDVFAATADTVKSPGPISCYPSKSISYSEKGIRLTRNKNKQVFIYRSQDSTGLLIFGWEIPAGVDSFNLDAKQLNKNKLLFSNRKRQISAPCRSGIISGKRTPAGDWIINGELRFKKKSSHIN